MNSSPELGGEAEHAPAFLDPSGTSSYQAEVQHSGEATAAETGRCADCVGSQHREDVAPRIALALRSVAEDEREQTYAGRFAELLPGRGPAPALPRPGFPRPPPGVSPHSYAWKTIRADTNRVYAKWIHRAESIESCGTMFVVLQCKCCGHMWAVPDPCGSRFCPKCTRSVRQRNIRKIQEVVGKRNGLRRFLTLTMRSDRDLFTMLDQLYESLVRLRARQWWKERVRGGICAMEVTYTFGTGWHVHAHLLVWGKYLPRPQLISEWQVATGCDCSRPRRLGDLDLPVLCCHSTYRDETGEYVRADSRTSECSGCVVEPTGVDIRKATDHDVAELCKYVGKDLGSGGGFLLDLDLAKEFLRVMWGRRMWTTFGDAFGIPQEDSDPVPVSCEACGSHDHRMLERTLGATCTVPARSRPRLAERTCLPQIGYRAPPVCGDWI